MNSLLKKGAEIIEKGGKLFEKGGKFEIFYPLYEAFETLLFVRPDRTKSGCHIRDNIDMKRMMMFVILGCLPAFLIGVYNAGYQHYLSQGGTITSIVSVFECIIMGSFLVLPIFIVVYAVGLIWEILFAVIRKEGINEGFFVTGFLIPLIVPPTIPLWQLGVAVSFGVVIGKELFGGTGMNIFNSALVTRAFLFFAYPASISGNEVWTYFGDKIVDSYTKATPLAAALEVSSGNVVDVLAAKGYTLGKLFIGFVPGCIGETSTIAILIGALFLLITGVASWRILFSVFFGGFVMVKILNFIAPSESSFLALPYYYHFVMGGFAFGAVFMATDPVTAAATNTGKYIYGFFIGFLAVMVRGLNPAYPEGMMLAILFMNAFAPLIDHIVVMRNIKRRANRATI